VTVHVPRQFYVTDLPGIPTIRVFEALACGIPLICSPWPDTEHLFMPGDDFLTVTTGDEMKSTLRRVIDDPSHAAQVAEHGRQTVLARHTCGHRVDELLQVLDDARRWRA
jgi:spore maturation protein CgeB